MSPAAAGARAALFYILFFAAMGAYLPFWPVWLADWGLTEAEVGLYVSAALAFKVIAGVGAPMLADFTGRPRRMTAALSLLAAALFIGHLGIGAPGLLFVATLAAAGAMAGVGPLGDALGLAGARSRGYDYARVRSAGSAAFLLASLATGWAMAHLGADAALWLIVASFALLAPVALRHPGEAARGEGVARASLGEALRLARSRPFLLMITAAAAAQASHAVMYAYGSLHWREQGLSEGVIGALWAFAVAAEVAFMLVAGPALARIGPARAIALAGGAAALRWTAMSFDPPFAALWPLQALHAVSFAAAHLGAMGFIATAAPPRLSASAQGLAGAGAVGVGMAAASAAAAWAYPVWGAGAYWIGTALGLLSLALAARLARIWSGERLDL